MKEMLIYSNSSIGDIIAKGGTPLIRCRDCEEYCAGHCTFLENEIMNEDDYCSAAVPRVEQLEIWVNENFRKDN